MRGTARSRKAAERYILPAKLYITYQDIYDALEDAGLPATVKNVVDLCNYIEGRTSDFARDVLSDWRERPTKLDEEEGGEL